MEKKYTELVFILDRSGSMAGLEDVTIEKFNSLLQEQKAEPGHVRVTTVLFDDQYELLHNRSGLQEIREITPKEYFVRGSTALLDALGFTVNRIAAALDGEAEKHGETTKQVLFVIITDGMENASQEFSYEAVRRLIRKKIETHGWEFIFLAADIDAEETAETYGISGDRAANFHADEAGIRRNYEAIAQILSEMRSSGTVSENWSSIIKEDYENRG
ncbi:MAG: VWA domain-containing protein [Spirochaetia bacterium]|nr:VWA domain-containing protein [Spirochaetia bacterium]